MKKRIVFALLLLALGAGALIWTQNRKRAVGSGPVQLYGNVDIREVNLGFRVSGRIIEVLRDEGDAAEAGEVLARLDAAPYERALAEAKAQMESLGARVRLVEAGYRPEEIAQARAVLREREVTLTNAERTFRRQQELLATRAVSEQDRDDAEARAREAQARLASAQEQLRLLEAGFRAEEIEQARAEWARARSAVARAELQLEDTVLRAPSAGVVLTRAQEPGAVVQAGATVLTLSLREPVWVRAYIREPDLGKIHPGMAVDIYTDSRPDKPYHGQIGYISPRAEFTPKTVETTELRTSLVYRLRVVVENPDEGLRQGMPVTVKLRNTQSP